MSFRVYSIKYSSVIAVLQLHGVAVDQSVEACKLTVENAHLNGVSDRLEVLTDTWTERRNFYMLLLAVLLLSRTCFLLLGNQVFYSLSVEISRNML